MWKPQNIYSDYLLYQPTVLFGRNSVSGLASYPCARVAVICGSSLHGEDKELLQRTFRKKSLHFVRRSWAGEPDLEGLKGTVNNLERIKPDTVVAIGGGSVIDGAKLCRLYYEFPFFKVNETRLLQLAFKTRFIAIPTTVGSGAEVSSAAVFIDRERGRKEMAVSHDLQPSVVVLDPGYVENAPEAVIAASMLDAVGHIAEGYVSVRRNGLTDIYAEKGLEILVREFSESPREKRDYQRIQFAGYLGGLVQNHCIVGAAHAVAHQLTAYGFSHGEAVALLLPGVIRLNSRCTETEGRYKRLCAASGVGGIQELTAFIEGQSAASGLLGRRDELKGILSGLVAESRFISNVADDRGGKGNPVPITEEYIKELVEAL